MNVSGTDVRSVDPALGADNISGQLALATCAHLLYYPDRNGAAGARIAPDAASFPRVSKNGRRYTFTIRKGFRFNTGEAVTAASFSRAFERALTPKMLAYAANFLHDIVGADAMLAGKTKRLAGVRATGNTLTITLTAPSPDFIARTVLPALCAVPPNTPADPNATGAPPAAGPYYVSHREPNRSVVLERNPYYHGPRPHHVDRIEVTVNTTATASLLQVEKGEADYDSAPLPATAHAELAKKFGVNRGRYHVSPFLETDYIALNASRPAMADLDVRRAVNFALDRRAIARQIGLGAATPTDQILPPGMPGFGDARIYPLNRPDVARAKALLHGQKISATFYVINDHAAINEALIIQADLKAIGIAVTIKQFPFAVFLTAAGLKDAPFDMALVGWGADYADPADFINVTLAARNITAENNINLPHFTDPVFQKRMDAAARLSGQSRAAAYRKLDSDLMRKAAPWAPVANRTSRELVSARVGCYVAQPVYAQLDLAAVCLK